MTYGYSQSLVEANKKANSQGLGVALGRLCIKKNVPVSKVANELGVSRATIYNWFWGRSTPYARQDADIKRFMHILTQRK